MYRDRTAGASLREWTAEDRVSIPLSSKDQTRGPGEIITLEARMFPLAAD